MSLIFFSIAIDKRNQVSPMTGCPHRSYNVFLKSIILKVNYKLYLFNKIRYMLTFEASVLVYKQMVLPFFDYLDFLIDSGLKCYIDLYKLQCLQFRGIKTIYQYHKGGRKNTNDEHYLHNELGLEFLDKRCRSIRHILHMMYDLNFKSKSCF